MKPISTPPSSLSAAPPDPILCRRRQQGTQRTNKEQPPDPTTPRPAVLTPSILTRLLSLSLNLDHSILFCVSFFLQPFTTHHSVQSTHQFSQSSFSTRAPQLSTHPTLAGPSHLPSFLTRHELPVKASLPLSAYDDPTAPCTHAGD